MQVTLVSTSSNLLQNWNTCSSYAPWPLCFGCNDLYFYGKSALDKRFQNEE